MKVCVVSHFGPLGLRCEMIVIPFDRILGCDIGHRGMSLGFES